MEEQVNASKQNKLAQSSERDSEDREIKYFN